MLSNCPASIAASSIARYKRFYRSGEAYYANLAGKGTAYRAM
jgi:hypothetical protein